MVSHLQDPSLPATLGSGPVGFTLSGVPIYGPFTEAGAKVGTLCTTTLPTCPFFSLSDEGGCLLCCAMWRLKHTVMAGVLIAPTHRNIPRSVLCLPQVHLSTAVTLDTCEGYLDSTGHYRTHYGPICETGTNAGDLQDCR